MAVLQDSQEVFKANVKENVLPDMPPVLTNAFLAYSKEDTVSVSRLLQFCFDVGR